VTRKDQSEAESNRGGPGGGGSMGRAVGRGVGGAVAREVTEARASGALGVCDRPSLSALELRVWP
jgi:hypothetical protein